MDEAIDHLQKEIIDRQNHARVRPLEHDEIICMCTGVLHGLPGVEKKIINDHTDLAIGNLRGLDFQLRVNL